MPVQPEDDELLDIDAVCRFWGGENTPLNPSTIYRNIKAGIIPPPIHPGANISRWVRSELRNARVRLMAERDNAA
jgi:predicted DNA-binding transcriptional regulator AlpA